ncbi:MAG: YdcF family protein [Parasphingopyxis sp.]|uniref:YdcF family protein n=1 Tax=Parasphingopyxis sp. TaxID=1920299 RepID=UPI002620AD0F|nr:YdcF family protein [uncultured Parasphingopyxis sp.]
MIRRIASLLVLAWVFGFAAFVLWLPGVGDDERETDAIIVLTGGKDRIERGIELMEKSRAERMLVSGVNRTVRPVELAEENGADVALFDCCIDLDQDSVDTRSNGEQAGEWLRRNDFKTVRLITTDWHMPRARFELSREIDEDVSIYPDAIESDPSFMQLFLEYNKYLLRRGGVLIGV